VSLIKQTSLGSIDSVVLENEVFQKDPIGESTSIETTETTEKQEEKKEEVIILQEIYYYIKLNVNSLNCIIFLKIKKSINNKRIYQIKKSYLMQIRAEKIQVCS
jgi:hypothetical protein